MATEAPAKRPGRQMPYGAGLECSAPMRRADALGAEREAGGASVGGVEVLALDVDVVAEPGDAATDHALGEVRERTPRAVRHLEVPRSLVVHFEARELGIGIELLHLAVDDGFDPRQQLEGGCDAVDEHGVERREGPEEVGAEASENLAHRDPRGLADARGQVEQLGLGIALEGAVCRVSEQVGGPGELVLREIDEIGEYDALHVFLTHRAFHPDVQCSPGAPAPDSLEQCTARMNALVVNAHRWPAGTGQEEDIMQNGNTWIAKVAAVVGLVGGLGRAADATVLSAGGFPIGPFSGTAYCVVTNDGVRDVTLNDMHMYDGETGNDEQPLSAPKVVPPGHTYQETFLWSAFGHPNSCTFDVSTKSGVRAAFI